MQRTVEAMQAPGMRETLAAKAASALNHPNIAAIYGIEEANGKPFLVLELIEGVTGAQVDDPARIRELGEEKARLVAAIAEEGADKKALGEAGCPGPARPRQAVLQFVEFQGAAVFEGRSGTCNSIR